jgi:putative phage-type endonuclease
MTIFLNDIEPLDDILDTLVFEEEPSIFSQEYAVELVESALYLMEEYMADHPTAISEPNFHETLLEELKDIFYIQLEDHILDSDYVEDDMNDLLEDAFNIYITTFHPERSLRPTSDDESDDCGELYDEEFILIERKIQALREIPQPVQRTPEWYKFRWNLITASNAWKAFETSQSTLNQLIYEKCQPLKDFSKNVVEEVVMVNTNTTLHWGQKYEPLSVMLYEHLYNSKVEDFGCIQHPVHKFIGASPDGIVIESNTGRYGRMLEIKNIVNREINGIPKKEYWIQMQLQMEVCDLNECDFLETKFIEYPDYESYRTDSSKAVFAGNEFNSYVTTADCNYKGIIVHFHKKEGKPHYEYMPLNIWMPHDVASWEETTVHKYESEPYNYIFTKFIYWRLEKLSCVLVSRNKEWFKNNVGQLETVWNTIEQERISGYEHRAPVKRAKKEPSNSYMDSKHNSDVCFLKVVKL